MNEQISKEIQKLTQASLKQSEIFSQTIMSKFEESLTLIKELLGKNIMKNMGIQTEKMKEQLEKINSLIQSIAEGRNESNETLKSIRKNILESFELEMNAMKEKINKKALDYAFSQQKELEL